MSTLFFLAIVLFVVGILLRSFFPKLCALCFAVSGSWLGGIFLYFTDVPYGDVSLLSLAIFMGGSAVGLMYYLSSRFSERFLLFKFPLLLTLFALVWFFLLGGVEKDTLFVLSLLWGVFITIFLLRHTAAKKWFKKIIECCKNW